MAPLDWKAEYAYTAGMQAFIQPGSPGDKREQNWLPTSAEQPWFVILRMYRPHPAVIQAKWECPGITPVT